MTNLPLTARVVLSASMAAQLPSGSQYGEGTIVETAESNGVPYLGTLFRVDWDDARPWKRTIFRATEIVPTSSGFSPVDAVLAFMAQHDEERPAVKPCDDNVCRNPAHGSFDCYARYAELEYEGPQGPEIMSRDEWARVQ